jgi:hypothetical protein
VHYVNTIRRLIAAFVIAGLVCAPFAQPAMMATAGEAAPAANMAHAVSAATMDDQVSDDQASDEMPCCPSKAPMPSGCDKCIFMAACAAKCLTSMKLALFQPPLRISAGAILPRSDFWPDGIGRPPPEHPPRTLV